jgi:hypothetical protein
MTFISTIGLLVHLQPIKNISDAARTTLSNSDIHQIQIQLVVVSGAALLALVLTINDTLGVVLKRLEYNSVKTIKSICRNK